MDIIRLAFMPSVLVLCLLISLPSLFSPRSAASQALQAPVDPSGRSGEPRLPEKQAPLRPEVPQFDLAPPEEHEATPPGDGAPAVTVFVTHIEVVGNTVLSTDELAEVTRPYEGRELSTKDLEQLRRALTVLYINKGYATSGATLPDQTITEGRVTYEIVEGILSDVRVQGTRWLRPSYVEDRVRLSTGPPFNMNPLRDRLQLLLQDPRIQHLNASVGPGAKPGEGVLDVVVQEASLVKAWVEFNNYQPPAVGAERGLATIQHQNLTGFGDTATFTYGQSRGVNPIIDLSYAVPLNRYDTTFQFGYRRNDFAIVDQAFASLQIESQFESFSVGLRQPVYRTLTDEVALSITGERVFNKFELSGIGFDLFPGFQNGVGNVSALRFGQEWTHRTQTSVLAVRSRMSLGLDVLGATIGSGPVADGQFFTWLGQVHWIERFESTGIELVNRLELQVANDRLFPVEQYGVGGRYTVRGYRELTLFRDNGFVYSIEPRVPLWTSAKGYDILQFASFVDVGRSWSAKGPTPSPETLASIGAGIRVNLFNRVNANVYWGQQLNHVPRQSGNLQDHGLHVQVLWNVFEY